MTLRPTSGRALLLTAVGAAAVGLLAGHLLYPHLPPRLPRGGAFTLLLLVVAEAPMATIVRARLRGEPGTRPIEPIVVARYAVLAKASASVGALVAGLWIGVGGYLLLNLRTYRRSAPPDLVTSALHVAGALLLVLVALRLERACRVPDGPPGGAGGPDEAEPE